MTYRCKLKSYFTPAELPVHGHFTAAKGPVLILYALTLVMSSLFKVQVAVTPRVTLKLKKFKYFVGTFQKAPMAHRQWSQEQYDIRGMHLIIHIVQPSTLTLFKYLALFGSKQRSEFTGTLLNKLAFLGFKTSSNAFLFTYITSQWIFPYRCRL